MLCFSGYPLLLTVPSCLNGFRFPLSRLSPMNGREELMGFLGKPTRYVR